MRLADNVQELLNLLHSTPSAKSKTLHDQIREEYVVPDTIAASPNMATVWPGVS